MKLKKMLSVGGIINLVYVIKAKWNKNEWEIEDFVWNTIWIYGFIDQGQCGQMASHTGERDISSNMKAYHGKAVILVFLCSV